MGARRATKSKSFYHISIKFRQSIKNSIFDRKAHVYYLLFNEIISSYQDKCVLHLKIRFQDSSLPHVHIPRENIRIGIHTINSLELIFILLLVRNSFSGWTLLTCRTADTSPRWTFLQKTATIRPNLVVNRLLLHIREANIERVIHSKHQFQHQGNQ